MAKGSSGRRLFLKPRPLPAFSLTAARGSVCVRRHPDDREHRDCHHTASVHVRLHRGPTLQGKVSVLPSPPISIPRKGALQAQQKQECGLGQTLDKGHHSPALSFPDQKRYSLEGSTAPPGEDPSPSRNCLLLDLALPSDKEGRGTAML